MRLISYRTELVAMVALFIVSIQAWAQPVLTETDNGDIYVIVEEAEAPHIISAPVVQAVNDAVIQYADDPEGLQQAIRAIIVEHAAGQTSINLATAVAIFTASKVKNNAQLLTAVALGASKGNPGISGGSLIASIPLLSSKPGPEEVIEHEIVRTQATVENPAQVVSPTSLQ